MYGLDDQAQSPDDWFAKIGVTGHKPVPDAAPTVPPPSASTGAPGSVQSPGNAPRPSPFGTAPADDANGSWLDSAVNFVKGFTATVNPLPMLEKLYGGDMTDKALNIATMGAYGQGRVAKDALQAQVDQFKKAKEAYDKGRISEAVGHTMAGALPLVGPMAADAGETIGRGDIAEGLGKTAGILAPMGVHPALGAAGDAIDAVKPAIADVADRTSANLMANEIAPKVGANKARFGNMAADAAPALAREPGLNAATRTGLQGKVGAAMEDAQQQLNGAYDAIPNTQLFKTAPVKAAINAALSKLTAEGYKDEVPTTTTVDKLQVKPGPGDPSMGGDMRRIGANIDTYGPGGTTVEPSGNEARIGALKQAQADINTLGDYANIDNLRKIAMAWGNGAKKVFTPAIAPDYMANKGAGLGFADAERSLRDYIADNAVVPGSAPVAQLRTLNSRYSMLRSANDVMQAAEEADRGRSGTMRSAGASVLGAAAGEYLGGPTAAAVGAILTPFIDNAVTSGVTTHIALSRALAKFADSLRSGSSSAGQAAVTDAAKATGTKATPVLLRDVSTVFKQLKEAGRDETGAWDPAGKGNPTSRAQELITKYPDYGYRKIKALLDAEGADIGEDKIKALIAGSTGSGPLAGNADAVPTTPEKMVKLSPESVNAVLNVGGGRLSHILGPHYEPVAMLPGGKFIAHDAAHGDLLVLDGQEVRDLTDQEMKQYRRLFGIQ